MIQKNLCALLGCLLFAATAFSQFQVGTQNLIPQDTARNSRSVDLDIYYPANTGGSNAAIVSGEFPLLVFGHGFSVAPTEYSIWYETLAAQGYIIAVPTTEGGITANHENFALDLSFLVDYFLSENSNSGSFFYQAINGKTAVMGHSMGGGCAWTAAAGNLNVTTMVTLAAAETNGVSAIASAATLTIPTLSIAGTEDCVLETGGGPIDMYNNLPSAPYHVYVDIIGASHCQFGIASFGSVCTLGELFCGGFMPIADQHTQMLLSAVDWLDYYLKDDCTAMDDLQVHLTSGNGTLHNYMDKGIVPACIVCPTDLTDANLGGGMSNAIPAATYQVGNNITSSGTVATGTNVVFDAGNIICLNAGFTVDSTADFTAIIGGCTP